MLWGEEVVFPPQRSVFSGVASIMVDVLAKRNAAIPPPGRQQLSFIAEEEFLVLVGCSGTFPREIYRRGARSHRCFALL